MTLAITNGARSRSLLFGSSDGSRSCRFLSSDPTHIRRNPSQKDDAGDDSQKHGNQITKDQIGIALSEVHTTEKKANDRAWINAGQNKRSLGQSLAPFRLSAHSQQTCGDNESAKDERDVIFKYLIHVIVLEQY